ncbi:probable pectinesterase 29 [Amborella trichopoda]|uniref:probable pectinesterase 29 n=1 Tax=Amborella trichopoda TaxID=13333 RepID=UPI0005D4005D|nr:probable pectinesterase 29 [Amborella trichopoda]|eukprot:XP_011621310.1 probable pectinesterase 29 [Amborella trichopoda]
MELTGSPQGPYYFGDLCGLAFYGVFRRRGIEGLKFLCFSVAFFICSGFEIDGQTGGSCQPTNNTVAKTINVDWAGNGDFKNIQSAIDTVPAPNSQWIRILVKAGNYSEKIKINASQSCIALEGEGMDKTFILWDDYAHDNISTVTSATFTVRATDFVARKISFQNTFPRNVPTQGVAVLVGGDRSAFYECGFYGYQDTLADYKGRHYFKDCYIQGSSDFIYGEGQSIYENCMLSVVPTPTANSNGYLAITANGRESTTDGSGFIFKSCQVFGSRLVYLGRAWQKYSRVIFSKSNLTNVVAPEGWNSWSYGEDTQ